MGLFLKVSFECGGLLIESCDLVHLLGWSWIGLHRLEVEQSQPAARCYRENLRTSV